LAAINSGIEEKLFKWIENSIAQTPFYNLLGLGLNELGPGFAEVSTATRAEHGNPLGGVHGGLLMSLADAAMANAVRSLGVKATTVDCATSMVSPAAIGEVLLARGQVSKAGKTLLFTDAQVLHGDKLIATAKGIFYRLGELEV
jgi:acyl-CoA thioesterase